MTGVTLNTSEGTTYDFLENDANSALPQAVSEDFLSFLAVSKKN